MAYIISVPNKAEILDSIWEVLTDTLPLDGDYRIAPQSAEAKLGTNRAVLSITAGPSPVEERDETRITEIENSDDLEVETVGSRELTLTVDYFGKDADFNASTASSLFNVHSFQSQITAKHLELYDQDLKVIESMGSQEVPNLLQSDYEPRFNTTIRLRTVSSIIETGDTIGSVTGKGEVTKTNDDNEVVDIVAP